MAGFSSTYERISVPNWLAEQYSADILIPGGARINVADPGLVVTDGKKRLPAGTLVGRTQAEADAGQAFGLFVTGDTDCYLVFNDNENVDFNSDIDLVRPMTLVKENWLPGWATMAAPAKAALRLRYQTINSPG
jgi:hypothetical protein